LVVGDIIHANSSRNSASLICLVTEVSEEQLITRRITTQDKINFNVSNGKAIDPDDGAVFTIDSVESLPADIHNALLRVDRVQRLVEQDVKSALSDSDKQAILFAVDFYPKHPLE
jgi:DNA-binding NtrC family response regulator